MKAFCVLQQEEEGLRIWDSSFGTLAAARKMMWQRIENLPAWQREGSSFQVGEIQYRVSQGESYGVHVRIVDSSTGEPLCPWTKAMPARKVRG